MLSSSKLEEITKIQLKIYIRLFLFINHKIKKKINMSKKTINNEALLKSLMKQYTDDANSIVDHNPVDFGLFFGPLLKESCKHDYNSFICESLYTSKPQSRDNSSISELKHSILNQVKDALWVIENDSVKYSFIKELKYILKNIKNEDLHELEKLQKSLLELRKKIKKETGAETVPATERREKRDKEEGTKDAAKAVENEQKKKEETKGTKGAVKAATDETKKKLIESNFISSIFSKFFHNRREIG